MSEQSFFVSASAARHLKRHAAARLPWVQSAHLSEAVAAALGLRTHAALRSALAERTTVEVAKPSNVRFRERLRELRYTGIPDDLDALPELTHNYLVFRREPITPKRSARWHAWRNLLVTALNAGLEQRLFGLEPGQNWWPGGAPESQACEVGTFGFVVDGNLRAVASVDCHAGDELSLYVIVQPRRNDIVPCFWNGLGDGDAVAHGWIERELGAWIQDGGEQFSCRRALQPRLVGMEVEPRGYADRGSFIF